MPRLCLRHNWLLCERGNQERTKQWISHSSGHRFCFVFGRSKVHIQAQRPAILIELFRCFLQSLQTSAEAIPQISRLSLPFACLTIHYSTQSGRELMVLAVAASKQHWPTATSAPSAPEHHWPMITCWSDVVPVVLFIFELCTIFHQFESATTVGETKIWQQCFILQPEMKVATSRTSGIRDH
jgi:hypothetical protein